MFFSFLTGLNDCIDQDKGPCHQDGHDQIVEHKSMITKYRRTTHKTIISTCYKIRKLNNSINPKSHLTDFPGIPCFHLVGLNQIDQAIGQEGPVTKDIVDRGYVRKRIGIKDGMNQSHDRSKDTNKSKILLESSPRSKQNNPHGHPAMIEGKTL